MIQSLDVRLSKVQVMAKAHELHHDECGVKNMFAMMSQACNHRRILTYLSKEDKRRYLLPRYAELVRIATSETFCFHRRLVLSILAALPVCDEPNSDLLDYCLTHLTSLKENSGTRSVMIKLAVKLCAPYPELCRELILCLGILPQDTPRSIAAAKKKALKTLKAEDGVG